MLPMSCCHANNTFISFSTCVANNVEESQLLLKQDMYLNGASSNSSSSLSITHICLMAKASEVSSILNPDASHNDDNDEENDIFLLLMRRVK